MRLYREICYISDILTIICMDKYTRWCSVIGDIAPTKYPRGPPTKAPEKLLLEFHYNKFVI